MIIITNNKDKIEIDETKLKTKDNTYIINSKHNYWEIELSIVFDEKSIIRIEKKLSNLDSSGDVLCIYTNKVTSLDKIVLSDRDYQEVSRLLSRFNIEDKFRIDSIIEATSILIAYECYMNYEMYELNEVKIDSIHRDVCCTCNYTDEMNKYKKEIYKRTKQILKEKYNVNFDYILDGGNENE